MLITQCPILRLCHYPFATTPSFGVRQAAGLSAISLLASFLPAPKFPFPTPLAKDAASIPNALAISTELRALGKNTHNS